MADILLLNKVSLLGLNATDGPCSIQTSFNNSAVFFPGLTPLNYSSLTSSDGIEFPLYQSLAFNQSLTSDFMSYASVVAWNLTSNLTITVLVGNSTQFVKTFRVLESAPVDFVSPFVTGLSIGASVLAGIGFSILLLSGCCF